MNILLINHYAGSIRHGMEFRPYYLGHEWTALGHNVTIVAATYSHLRNKAPDDTKGYAEEFIDGVRYVWLKTPAYRGNGVRRVMNMFAFVGQLFRYRKRIIRDFPPDAVIASSTYPLDIYPAHRIAKACKAKLVFELHDIWPLTPIEIGGMSRLNPFIVALQLAENFACRKSDRIVSILPLAAAHLCEHGMAKEKFVHIPNGVVLDDWQPKGEVAIDGDDVATIKSWHDQGYFVIGYAGAHGAANALNSLIDAAALLRDEPVAFVLIGDGPEKERLRQECERRSLSRVLFVSRVEKAKIPILLELMDSLYIGLTRCPLFRFGVSPNKLMDYMMAARPIIHAISAGNDLVAEAQCGVSCPAEDPAAIADAIVRLAELPKSERDAMGERGKSFVIQNHDYRILAQRFLAALA